MGILWHWTLLIRVQLTSYRSWKVRYQYKATADCWKTSIDLFLGEQYNAIKKKVFLESENCD